MKVLKKRGTMLFLIAALIVTLTLGIIFAMPARTASAEEGVSGEAAAEEIVYTNTVKVSDEKTLKDTVKNAGETPTKIILENNIEMNSISSKEGKKFYEVTVNRKQVIEIDLAGHILSTAPMEAKNKPVIYNYGTLSIIDSSGDYSGAVVSNGYIEKKSDGYYWDASNNVIENYGALTVDANLRMNCPSAASWGTGTPKKVGGGSNVNSTNISKIYLIYNLFEAPKSEELIYPTSLTINGGNFDLAFSNYYSGTDYDMHMPPMEHFFYLGSTDLTINGGTFRNTASREPYYQGGFLANIQVATSIGSYESLLKDVLHMDIKITGGDFGDKNLLNSDKAFVYVDDFKQKRDGDEYVISITGGTFPLDLSAYVSDPDYMMMEDEQGFYSLVEAKKADPIARLDQNVDSGSTPIAYFSSFDAALFAAQLRMAMGQNVTIQLLKNAEAKPIIFENTESDVSLTLDLNGHELKVAEQGKGNTDYHITVTNVGGASKGVRTMIVCDTSSDKSGKLNLVYFKDTKGGGISIGKQLKFVLESGTLTRTGGGFHEEPNGQVFNSTSERNKSIFYFPFSLSSNPDGALVTILGGNILSELEGSDRGYLASTTDGRSEDYDDYLNDYDLNGYKEYITIDVADYLSKLEKGQGCRFSWNVEPILPEGVTGVTTSDGSFVVTYTQENENYMVSTTPYQNLSDAVEAAQVAENHTVTLLHDVTEEGDVEIPEGIKLDLNQYLHYTITAPNVILHSGSSLVNGTVNSNIVVKGKANVSALTVKGNVTVEASGKLVIGDGTYDGTLSAAEGGKLSLIGGKYLASGESYIPYIQAGFGAAAENGGYRTVKAGIASGAALAWYESKGSAETGIQTAAVTDTYYINNEDEFLYFTSIVNSGKDNFSSDEVILNGNLNFADYAFLPAGTVQKRFAGTFNGNDKTVSHANSQEYAVGLFGATDSSFAVSKLTIENSTFTAGSGFLDEYNASLGYLAAGSVVGDGYLSSGTNITLTGSEVRTQGGKTYLGAMIGHTWSPVSLSDITMTDNTLDRTWKSGGVVGYTEDDVIINNLEITGLTFEGEGFFPSGVLAGDLNGSKADVTNATIDCPDLPLNGVSSSKADVNVSGSKTDIHVESLGNAGNFNFTLDKDETDSAQLQVGSALPENVTIQDSEGKPVEQEPNPDGDGFIMQAAPKKVEVYYGDGEIRGSYETLQDAINAAEEGDRIYLKESLDENNITVGADKNVTINLYNNTLTGTITVQGTLTLENGVITAESGDVVTVSDGTLILAVPALGEGETAIKELTITATDGKAINGEYTVVTNGNDVCVRKGEQEVKLAAEHDKSGTYTYTADGDTITVHCVHDDAVLGTVTVVAPADLVYSGTALEAKVVVEPVGLVAAPEVVYKNANGDVVKSVVNGGVYTANITLGEVTASVEFTVKKAFVRIGGISAVKEYDGSAEFVGEVTEATITLSSGETKTAAELGLTVTVKLVLSDSKVGTHTYAKIVEINVTGDGTVNYDVELSGNQAFIEVEVTGRALTVRVNSDGSVSYEGFVNGEDESVLEGELHLERVDNGDGTSTVTPSGLTSANYVITFESGIVENEQSNALWITLAVVGGVIAALGAVAVVYAVRRKKN